jgi:hypothetical protein
MTCAKFAAAVTRCLCRVLGCFLTGSCAEAKSEHITLVRRVIVEKDLNADACAIDHAVDGGYVIPGSLGARPWTMKVRIAAAQSLALLPACLLAGSCVQAKAEHIAVSREVLLEPGNAGAHAYAIARTADRGYVVAGVLEARPRATKVNGQGEVVWRHILGKPGEFTAGGPTMYTGIVGLKSGAFIFCGTISRQDANRHVAGTFGVLTKLEADGRVVHSESVLAAGVKEPYTSEIQKCIPSKEGEVAIGTAVRFPMQWYWLIGLDPDARVVSRKVIRC